MNTIGGLVKWGGCQSLFMNRWDANKLNCSSSDEVRNEIKSEDAIHRTYARGSGLHKCKEQE